MKKIIIATLLVLCASVAVASESYIDYTGTIIVYDCGDGETCFYVVEE